jgi:hypothetical protein
VESTQGASSREQVRDKPIVIPIRNFFHSNYQIQEYNVRSIVPFYMRHKQFMRESVVL